jgi:hypothetical protein
MILLESEFMNSRLMSFEISVEMTRRIETAERACD